MERTDTQAPTLVVRQLLRAARARVFEAWTDPQAVTQWFGPRGCECLAAEVDARVGGRFRVELGMQGGPRWSASGIFVEIDRPSRIVMTWRWSGTPQDDDYESLLSIDITERGASSELVLTHERLPARARSEYDTAWQQSIQKMQALLERAGV